MYISILDWLKVVIILTNFYCYYTFPNDFLLFGYTFSNEKATFSHIFSMNQLFF